MKSNYKKVMRVLIIILLANVLVAIIKMVLGFILNSSSICADGLHSFSDGSSNIIGLIGIYFASKPIDKDHPYGHKKFETLAGLLISGLLFFISIKVLIEAVIRFIRPQTINISFHSLLIILFTIGINIFVCKYESIQGEKLKSYILISDSIHTKSDIFVSIGVLITILCIKLGLPPIIDPIASLLIAGFIMKAGWEIFSTSSSILVDAAAVEIESIEEITKTFKKVKSVHKIRSRGSESQIYIDMHILTDPLMTVKESHELMHNIEETIRQELNASIELIVHIEPNNYTERLEHHIYPEIIE